MVTVFNDTKNLTCSFLKTLHIVELLLPHYKSVAKYLQGAASPFKKGKKKNFNFMHSTIVH